MSYRPFVSGGYRPVTITPSYNSSRVKELDLSGNTSMDCIHAGDDDVIDNRQLHKDIVYLGCSR